MMAIAIAGVFGLAFGSFANAAVDRLATGRSLFGRSCCDACQRLLRAFELIPVLSYIALRGRCAACHARIGARTVVVESTFGVVFAVCFSLTAPMLAAALCSALTAVAIGGLSMQRGRSAT
jgi:prepilin signal peptidase PulO-like enzyme (type II secretory pathway)